MLAFERKCLSWLNTFTSVLTRPKFFFLEAKTWWGLIPGGRLRCVIVLSHGPQLGCDRCLLGSLQDHIVTNTFFFSSCYSSFCWLGQLTFLSLLLQFAFKLGKPNIQLNPGDSGIHGCLNKTGWRKRQTRKPTTSDSLFLATTGVEYKAGRVTVTTLLSQ